MNNKSLSAAFLAGIVALSLIPAAEAKHGSCQGNNGNGWGRTLNGPPGLIHNNPNFLTTGNPGGHVVNPGNWGSRWGYNTPNWGNNSQNWGGSWLSGNRFVDPSRIDTIQSNLSRRIQDGVTSGRLTQREADRLMSRASKIDQIEARFRDSGGSLDYRESNRLADQLRDLRTSLGRDLSDRQFR